MEGLYTINKAQYHQLVTHVSVYRQEPSPSYKALAEECLKLVGLRPEKHTIYDVPDMQSLLGKTIPIDVHGGNVLIDQGNALKAATRFGVLKYAILAAAVRSKEGGKYRYDFITMNFALTVGCVSGFGFLSVGRKRWGWMRRRPVGCVVAAFAVCLAATALTRTLMRIFGFGLIMAEKGHKKALTKLDCVDCMDDVNTYTSNQIVEMRNQKLPQQPGMPPPPEEFVKRFEKGIATQIKLLEIDMEEVRILKKRMDGHLCVLHKGLREAPDTFVDPTGFPILDAERAAAKTRPPASQVAPPKLDAAKK